MNTVKKYLNVYNYYLQHNIILYYIMNVTIVGQGKLSSRLYLILIAYKYIIRLGFIVVLGNIM